LRKDITVAAQPRESRGKNEARRTRRSGLIPAVVYGAYKDPVPVAVSPKAILQIVHSTGGYNTIFNLDIEGRENTPVMVVDHQNDPIRGTLLHADLKRIDLTKRIAVKVRVHTTGEPKGVKLQGGLLEMITREVEIECLPDDIPEQFTVDVSELMVGQSIRAGEIAMSQSIHLLSPADAVISHIVTIKAEEEPAAAAGAEGAPAATAEPEVIKKGKKEEEAPVDEKKKK